MTKPKSFEAFFDGLHHEAKVRIANRRIQKLDLDIAWCDTIGYRKDDDWYLYSKDEMVEMRQRWRDVRDRLVWDNEEVTLS